MHRLEHEMALAVDELLLGARIAAPENEHEVLALGAERADGGIGELLPAVTLMTRRLMRTHRERCVQQEHALLSPARQVARRRDRLSEVELYLLEDVLKRRRKRHACRHREAQTLRLTRLVVRVLTDNHHLHRVERTEVEGVEDERTRRIARRCGIFLAHEVGELGEIGLLKLRSDMLAP